MLRLMQLPGVNYRGAFALDAAVEDPKRFSKASKLAACGGFSPIVDSSGDGEERARRKGGLGKPRNKVACAIGRKLLTYGWHILRGDPTPNRDGEEFFKRKMRGFHQAIGAKRMRELGYGTRNEFADAQAAVIYGGLPKTTTAEKTEKKSEG